MKRKTMQNDGKGPNSLIAEDIANLSEDTVRRISFSMPWSDGAPSRDEDGFKRRVDYTSGMGTTQLSHLQALCWEKFITNPQVSSSVRDTAGAVAGAGFDISSSVPEVQAVIKEAMFDPRNKLKQNAKKIVSRKEIDGELFLCLTVHDTGFVEIDFIDPKAITGAGSDGVICHPDKPTLPLAYHIRRKTVLGRLTNVLIPSIYIAYYPDLLTKLAEIPVCNATLLKDSAVKGTKYKKLSNFKRFIVAWDNSLFTTRNVGHLRATLEWINLYENLKKYEIDHKKSSGSYLWVAEMADARTYQLWMSMTEQQKRETGLMRSKSPGSTVILPPGVKLTVQNPSLPKISDTDTDILQMITSGLNKPEDIVTGQSKGTFASVKASRGPQSDRMNTDKEDFMLFLKQDLFRAIFFLKNALNPEFKLTYKVRKAVDFVKNEPVFKDVDTDILDLVDVTMPNSAMDNLSDLSSALLGVKHGSLVDTLGIPYETIARYLGFSNYKSLRLQHATEVDTLPKVQATIDAETAQENKLEPASSGPEKGSGSKPSAKKPMPKPKTKVKGGNQ